VGSPFAPVVLTIAALIAALVRWQIQGSHNLYHAFTKRFYVSRSGSGLADQPEASAVDAAGAVWVVARSRRRSRSPAGSSGGAGRLGHRASRCAVPHGWSARCRWRCDLAFASGVGPPNAVDTLPLDIQGIEPASSGSSTPRRRYGSWPTPGSRSPAPVIGPRDSTPVSWCRAASAAAAGDPHDSPGR